MDRLAQLEEQIQKISAEISVLRDRVGKLEAAPPQPLLESRSESLSVAILAVLMAWSARKYSLRELGWLVYPLLVGEGMRLLLEDIRYGRPSTLFVTLALYGGALIATSSLMRKTPVR